MGMVSVLELGKKIMCMGYICDRCLGRQFAELLTGMDNAERGRIVRLSVAMEIDRIAADPEELKKFEEDESEKIRVENFVGITFHNNKHLNIQLKEVDKENLECFLCGNIMERLDEMARNVVKELEGYEFETFLVGVKLPEHIESAEAKLWEEIGGIYAESIRNEITREVGKRVQQLTGKKVEFKKPDVTVILNLQRNVIELIVSSLYIYGRYNKYKEMPQARWVCRHCNGVGCKRCEWKGRLYDDSVQDRIGEILLEMTKGVDTKIHGAGREDIDALCTGWREFVIEILEPRKRKIDLKKAEKEINKRNKGVVEVKDLKIVDKDMVRIIKEKRSKKIYEAIVRFEKEIDEEELKKLKGFQAVISQKTPTRVLHRRSDKVRKRRVKIVDVERIDERRAKMIIEADAGTYIKEFVNGDGGRTRPSVAELLNSECEVEKLIVAGFIDNENSSGGKQK